MQARSCLFAHQPDAELHEMELGSRPHTPPPKHNDGALERSEYDEVPFKIKQQVSKLKQVCDALEQIFLTSLKKQFEQLSTWEGPDALVKVWRVVFDVEHVLQGRLHHITAGLGCNVRLRRF